MSEESGLWMNCVRRVTRALMRERRSTRFQKNVTNGGQTFGSGNVYVSEVWCPNTHVTLLWQLLFLYQAKFEGSETLLTLHGMKK